MGLIKAYQKDQQLLDDIAGASNSSEELHLWWLGQSGFLIKHNHRHVLLDPYLSDSLTRKYAETDKPHIRMSELVIDPARLDFIDIVTSSHNHTDHLDAETLRPLIKVNPEVVMVGPRANREFIAQRIGEDIEFVNGLNDGESIYVKDIEIIGVPAAHNELDRDEEGNCLCLGYVLKIGKWTIYHSGDTLWHPDIIEALRSYYIDLAILPINGNKPERRVAGNLDYREAVKMGRLLEINTVIPCHYDMFTFNTEDVSRFVNESETTGQGYKVFLGGERFTLS